MNTVFFSAPANMPAEAVQKVLTAVEKKEGIGMVVCTDKHRNMPEHQNVTYTPINRRKFGASAVALANSKLLLAYMPDLALICPGQKDEMDAIARCLDASIPVMLFTFDGDIKETLTKEALEKHMRRG